MEARGWIRVIFILTCFALRAYRHAAPRQRRRLLWNVSRAAQPSGAIERVEALGFYLKYEGALPRVHYQFIVLSVGGVGARAIGARFRMADHVQHALAAAGLPQNIIDGIAEVVAASPLSASLRAVAAKFCRRRFLPGNQILDYAAGQQRPPPNVRAMTAWSRSWWVVSGLSIRCHQWRSIRVSMLRPLAAGGR